MEETSKIFIEAFKQLPNYSSAFAELISSPIHLIQLEMLAQEIDDEHESTDTLAKALIFASVSALIVIMAEYTLSHGISFSAVLTERTLVGIFDIIFIFFIFSIAFKMIFIFSISFEMTVVNVYPPIILISVLYYSGICAFINVIFSMLEIGATSLSIIYCCLFVLPARALALSANLNYRQGIGLAVILVPALLAEIWVINHIHFFFASHLPRL